MNLVVDHGNTNAKVGIFDHQMLREKFTFAQPEAFDDFIKKQNAENVIVSSVQKNGHEILERFSAKNKFLLSPQLSVPVINHYTTPATLGMDRLAGVCGAKEIFPKENCLVIDAGTCVTFDFVDKDGEYLGGSISPGLMMRFHAMHTFTAKLPLVSPNKEVKLVGASTEQCMQSGVLVGMSAEIDGIIERYSEKFGNIRAILCGGDAVFFENQLKASIFASPELVLIGLNSILNHNVSH